MRLPHPVNALYLLIILLAAAPSLPHVSAFGNYYVLSHVMCKSVVNGVCRTTSYAFDMSDTRAYLWFKVRIGETGTLRASDKWYYQSESIEEQGPWDPLDVYGGREYWFSSWIGIRDQYGDHRGFWKVEVYIEGNLEFTEYFTIEPYYEVQIKTDGIPDTVSVPIRVDANDYGQVKGGEVKKLGFVPGTSHELSVQDVEGSAGVRWVAQENTWQFSGGGAHSFKYEEEYQLSIETYPDGVVTVSGAGWYKSGTTVDIGQVPETMPVDSGTQFTRDTIVLDGKQVSSAPPSITMDKPHTMRVQYRKQCYLNVTSDYGSPTGEGWHDAGSTVAFSVTSPAPEAGVLGYLGGKVIFQRWTGDTIASAPSASVLMDGPKSVRAEWQHDNIIPYAIIGAIAAAVVVVVLHFIKRREALARDETRIY